MNRLVVASGLLAALMPLMCAVRSAAAAGKGDNARTESKRSFIVTSFDLAQYETKFWDECPLGPAIGEHELTFLSLLEAAHTGRPPPDHPAKNCWVQSPPQQPMRIVEGDIAYGMNLDGKGSNEKSPLTCPHQNFTSPTGEPGIDNQLYRLMGCVLGWRRTSPRNIDVDADNERRSTGNGLVLIEIDNVDDLQNDDHVTVTFYRSIDAMRRDGAGNVIPFASYRIDVDAEGRARYGATAQGRIVNGVLTTEPVDLELPDYGAESIEKISLRGARLEMRIDDSKLSGLVAGYNDLETWFHRLRNNEYKIIDAEYSCPAVFEAARRLADGYPDPKTGECTAISAAFQVEGVAAFAIHPPANQASTASSRTPSASLTDRKAK